MRSPASCPLVAAVTVAVFSVTLATAWLEGRRAAQVRLVGCTKLLDADEQSVFAWLDSPPSLLMEVKWNRGRDLPEMLSCLPVEALGGNILSVLALDLVDINVVNSRVMTTDVDHLSVESVVRLDPRRLARAPLVGARVEVFIVVVVVIVSPGIRVVNHAGSGAQPPEARRISLAKATAYVADVGVATVQWAPTNSSTTTSLTSWADSEGAGHA